MVNNIKVSIIVPVYNTAKYLHKCLDSIKNQTLGEIEIICVNDGSTDNSLEILNAYAREDSRLIVLSQENQGQSSARNTGILIAKGEFIGFVDSDDWVGITMFENLYNNSKEYNSDISMCSITTHCEKTKAESTNDPYMTLNLFSEKFENRAFSPKETYDFIFRICVVPWNKLYKREYLMNKNIQFPVGLYFEDNVFFCECFLQAKNISLIKEPLYFYRKASETSTTTGDDAKKMDFFTVFQKIEEFIKKDDTYLELTDYFNTHKKNTLKYWYKKLKNAKVKEKYQRELSKHYSDTSFLF